MSIDDGDGPAPEDLEKALLAAIEHAESVQQSDIAASLRIILEHWRRKRLPNGHQPPDFT